MSLIDCVSWQLQKNLFSEIIALVKLLLLPPATNAISEWSCSTLRRIKTYLHFTITQSWLNHCMMLNIPKEALGELSLVEIANEFCREMKRDWIYLENLVSSIFVSILSWRCQWQHRFSSIFLCFSFLTVSLTKYNN